MRIHRGGRAFGAALLSLSLALPAAAAGRAKEPAPAPVAPPLAPVAPPPAAAVPTVSLEGTPAQLLERARSRYAELEYDDVLALTRAVLARSEATNPELIEAHRLQGSALAGGDQAIEAEKPFRLLLRLQKEFELPPSTQPKILAVFRKVQAEERELQRQSRALGRERLMAGITLVGEPPARGFGGYPLRFRFQLRDPTGAVESVLVPYREQGQPTFSTLALERDDLGGWRGVLPGDVTANPSGKALEFYVEARDGEGSLAGKGRAQEPLRIDLSPGTSVRERPPPLSPWLFWTGVGTTLAAGVATGGAALLTRQVQSNRDAYVGREPLLEASRLEDFASEGRRWALLTNVGLGVTGALLVATGVTSRFVNWDGVPDPDAAR